jgi:GIY-YIG catalytic domain
MLSARAPLAPGVYFLLGADSTLLYVGKASNLRRRLASHTHKGSLYEHVAAVRWELCDDPEAREADLILALQPVFNASISTDGRWRYVVVEPGCVGLAVDGGDYGCFPHLGAGVTSVPGIACRDGYGALLRLLWAAGPGPPYPAQLARRAPPDRCDLTVDGSLQPALHAFLSGTTDRLLSELARRTAPLDAYLQTALARDIEAARRFFRYGPHAVRALRLRHGMRSGPMSRERIEQLLRDEVRAAIGDFRIDDSPDPTRGLLGRRDSRTQSIAAARREFTPDAK